MLVSGSKVLAGTVWEGSRAQKMGMYSGCEIIQINNTRFSDLANCEVEKAISGIKERNVIQVVYIDKKGQPQKIKVKKQ